MKNILKNSSLVLIFIIFILFKDYLYMFLDKKEYNFNFIKENELEYYKNEYEKLIDIKNDNNYLLAKVIFRNVYNFYNEMTISKGKNYNIKKGDYVIFNNSLIGIIYQVDDTSSKVYLFYNKNFQLSVKINNTYGILKSDNNKLYVKNIIDKTTITKDDLIYTSGLTDIMPNILIGKVDKVYQSTDELEQIVEVKQMIDIKKIDYVMVVSKEKS